MASGALCAGALSVKASSLRGRLLPNPGSVPGGNARRIPQTRDLWLGPPPTSEDSSLLRTRVNRGEDSPNRGGALPRFASTIPPLGHVEGQGGRRRGRIDPPAGAYRPRAPEGCGPRPCHALLPRGF